jgi:hypothetical protein
MTKQTTIKERKDYISDHINAVVAFDLATGVCTTGRTPFPTGFEGQIREIEKLAQPNKGKTIGDLARRYLDFRAAHLASLHD